MAENQRSHFQCKSGPENVPIPSTLPWVGEVGQDDFGVHLRTIIVHRLTMDESQGACESSLWKMTRISTLFYVAGIFGRIYEIGAKGEHGAKGDRDFPSLSYYMVRMELI